MQLSEHFFIKPDDALCFSKGEFVVRPLVRDSIADFVSFPCFVYARKIPPLDTLEHFAHSVAVKAAFPQNFRKNVVRLKDRQPPFQGIFTLHMRCHHFPSCGIESGFGPHGVKKALAAAMIRLKQSRIYHDDAREKYH